MEAMSMNEAACWTAVVDRDEAAAGRFVYAVRTTGIFCRAGCASRRPRRENVAFYPLPEAARAAGFRACLRCRPDAVESQDERVVLVRRACRLIEAADESPPGLAELGQALGASPFHLQRLMRQFLGLSPKEYADALRIRRFRDDLKAGEGIAGATFGAGFGSSSRVYERAARELGMTPGRYRRGGTGERIAYAAADGPLGQVLAAATDVGVCFVALGDDVERLKADLAAEFPAAELAADDSGLADILAAVIDYLEGRLPHPELPLDLRGTAFQRRVWQELQKIPSGDTASYGEIARRIGQPAAVRAVARACATNPAALVVPCHRVVRGDGTLSGYRWGTDRKASLLKSERERAVAGTGGRRSALSAG
ncbi:AraC family transcriptional regulator of adaptative response/methylated-DNA-[protein]-cysteine methyltransferase [Stella humosa]|uniref:methylated-DNA--[protein]-cysteine S-methyltransferase n=1 Tax=Stella humosa TaxID=94 RepID=A0A3N1L0Q5_9PROT|nr:bifunctional DNA-binding transcriptional regulator/O6-methylguanine-DNA methyltransferase Ada [Stella humosa]ROP83095.1 AraC family transcriptional regulator of adaptative response/methylated-DNA-[protein]-cysteine methyltransferase [Stella humosa]BBK30128.1 bifunctional transcriptional activator/DNA repair enzyme protein Ada [Stella humosa]